MNWPLIILGSLLITINVREGAKRKLQGDNYWMAQKEPTQRNSLMTLLLVISLMGLTLIVLSGGSILRNIVIALIVMFVIAPSIAGFTTGPSIKEKRKILREVEK